MNEPSGIPSGIQCDADPSAISIEEARRRICEALPRPSRTIAVTTADALGRVVAADVVSPVSVPSFRASAMDGYAIRMADTTDTLIISGKSLAGHPGPDNMPIGTCQRITTGARVPDQADAVVQQENVEVSNNRIRLLQPPVKGLNIREPGSDSQELSLLISSGTRVGPAEIALLAAHGIHSIEVYERLKIALFSTGDELVNPGDKLDRGQIYDANRPLLKALLENPAVQVIDLGICPDTVDNLEHLLKQARDVDVIVSSGGVSVGEADYVKQVLELHGKIDVWKIAMKPGRPLTFGIGRNNVPFFGLPGNPVSAAITCLLFVCPAIKQMLGSDPGVLPALMVRLNSKLSKNPGRVEYQRAILSKTGPEDWQVDTTGLQDSHVLTSLHKANCLIELPVDSSGAEVGEMVRVYPFTHFSPPAL